MNLYNKRMTRIILAISLIMLIGGIIGSVYYSVKIDERLDWAESIGDPKYTKKSNYRIVEDEVTSLGTYLGVSADVAIIGGLTCLALLFRRRFQWEGVRGFAFSLLGGLIMLPMILGAILAGLHGGIVVGVMAVLFLLGNGSLLLRRRWKRSVFILGGLLVMLGVFFATQVYIWLLFDKVLFDQDFQILYWFIIMIIIGVAILLGILFILGAIFWPRRKADKLEDATKISLFHQHI